MDGGGFAWSVIGQFTIKSIDVGLETRSSWYISSSHQSHLHRFGHWFSHLRAASSLPSWNCFSARAHGDFPLRGNHEAGREGSRFEAAAGAFRPTLSISIAGATAVLLTGHCGFRKVPHSSDDARWMLFGMPCATAQPCQRRCGRNKTPKLNQAVGLL